MPTAAPMDWATIILGANSVLLAIVLALGGYIWRRAIKDLDEFRDANREEHKAFMSELTAVKEAVAYMKGTHDAEAHAVRAARK